jgi:hypothetical protein
LWALKEPINDALIGRRLTPAQPVIAPIDPLNLKMLPGLDVIHLAYVCGKDELTFAGDDRFHS